MNIVKGLTTFLAVVDAGGFTRAAEALGTAQPPLSRSVAELERHLGARLFDRSQRGARLTDAGARLLPEARELARRLDALPGLVAASAEGQPLRLGIPPSTDPRRIHEVEAALVVGGVRVALVPVPSAEVGRALAEARIDAAVSMEAVDAPGEADWVVPLVAASSRFEPGPAIPLDELRGRPVLGLPLPPSEAAAEAIILLPEDAGLRASPRHLSALVARGVTFRQLEVAASEFDAVSHVSAHGSVLLCPASVARKYGLAHRALSDGGLARPLVLRGSARWDLRASLEAHPEASRALRHVLEASLANEVHDDLRVVHLENRRVDERLFPI